VPIDMVPAANALGMTVFSLGVIVGPLLVGILIPLVGLPWLYFIDALTLVAILYAVIKLPPIPPLGEHRGRAKVLDGIRYLRLQPLLLMTFVVDIIAMVCGMPRALFPQMAQETFGGPAGGGLALGMLNAGLAIGSLIGGLTGVSFGFFYAIATSLDWPLVTGGKPIVSLPPYIVIGFETTILLGALVTVAGMFLNARLPKLGRSPGYDPRFSCDKIGIVAFGGPSQLEGAREVLRDAGAEEVRDV